MLDWINLLVCFERICFSGVECLIGDSIFEKIEYDCGVGEVIVEVVGMSSIGIFLKRVNLNFVNKVYLFFRWFKLVFYVLN